LPLKKKDAFVSHGKVIDFYQYQTPPDTTVDSCHHTLSEELIHAIELLIQRLRDHDPMTL
jgi:hypothetical protein